MSDTLARARQSETTASGDPGRRLPVISCDGHVGPAVVRQLRPYCDPKYLDRFDAFVVEWEASKVTEANETVDTQIEIPQEWIDSLMERAQVAGLQDPQARLADMDADGIAAEILYHGGANGETFPFSTFALAQWGSSDYNDVEWVGVRMYNRWLADFVSEDPHRLLGVGHITVRDFDEAIHEIEFCKQAGLVGINLPAPRLDFTPYTDRAWERIWAACQDLDLTLCTHGGGGDLDPRLTGFAKNPIFLMEYPWFGRRGLWHLICSGVFHRYPRLRLALAEQFGDWVPDTLIEMDSSYLSPHFSAALRKVMPNRPSEYFATNCYIGASFMSRAEAEIGVAHDLTANLMWGSDYPHPEGSFPKSAESLRKTMAGLSEQVVDDYLWRTASTAYSVDLDRLNDVAAQVGPTFGDLMQPLNQRPEGMATSFAFREFGHWA